MVQVYLSNKEKRRVGLLIKGMYSSVVPAFFAGLSLHRKQLSSEKHRSRLTVLWSLLEPLFLGIIFVGLYQYRAIAPLESGMPYALFVISGVMLWQSLMDGFNIPLGTIGRSKELLLTTKVMPEALMWAAVIRVSYNSTFRILIIVAFAIYFQEFQLQQIGLALAYFYLATILICGLGFMLEPFNAVVEDVSRVLNLVLRPLMFVSGAIFPVKDIEALSSLNEFNFLFLLVENFRAVLLGNKLYEPQHLLVLFCALLVVFLLAWYVFHVSVRLVAEKG